MILMLWTDVCLAMNRSVADAELPAALPADARAARERGLAGDSDGADGIALQRAGRGVASSAADLRGCETRAANPVLHSLVYPLYSCRNRSDS
jgi:hypothetical protein